MAKWIYGVGYMISGCCNKKYDVRNFAHTSNFLDLPCKCPNCATYLDPPDTELLELVGLDNEDNTSKHLHWDSHKRHWELLKEVEETLLAIQCSNPTLTPKQVEALTIAIDILKRVGGIND